VVATDAKPVADIVAPVLETLFPGLAVMIQAGDSLISKIAKQALVAETTVQAVEAAPTGPAKLQAVLANVTPDIDAWVENAFPGSAKLTDIERAGLVNAIVAILNKVAPQELIPVTPAALPASPKA
jgi:hypothetical protein